MIPITPIEKLGYITPNFNDRMKILSETFNKRPKQLQIALKVSKAPLYTRQSGLLKASIAANKQSAAYSGIVFGSGGRGTGIKTDTGGMDTEIRDRQKDGMARDKTYSGFLIAPNQLSSKKDTNFMALQEAYKTAETDKTGFSAKDQRDSNYAKKFEALELDDGGKMYDVNLKEMFREQKVASDIGAVRRKPRLGYL